MLAALAREVKTRNRPFATPTVLLSGGETTVTIRGTGRGGRNAEFLLAFALAIDGIDGITALAADTDGIDGAGDNAGAVCDGTTAARMRAAGVDPRRALADNDAYNAFRAVDGLFITNPTGTNVNDFRAIIVEVRKHSMAGALGIGGFFFRSRDIKALAEWYAPHLGVTDFWTAGRRADDLCAVQGGDDLFPADKQWMINFRVDDIDALMAQLKDAGIAVETRPTEWDTPETGALRPHSRSRGQPDRAVAAAGGVTTPRPSCRTRRPF